VKPLNLRTLAPAVGLSLLVAGATAAEHAVPATARAATTASSSTATPGRDDDLTRAFGSLTRNTVWEQTGQLHLDFPTYHTEGLAVTPEHLFLSSVQIIEPTKTYPSPVGGYDRTPGKGIGHLFVMDRAGNLQKDIVLGEGDMYHPGGLDFDGRNVWVPVAQYRPNSSAIIYRVDATSLGVTKQFTVADHIGGIVFDRSTGHLVGNNWGSRRFYAWTVRGQQITSWDNPQYFIDYQDCQYAPAGKMICGGITNLPQTPAAGGTAATYELGGLALIDLRSHTVLHELPFQKWSTAGHVMTRNPLKMAADGDHVTLWAAPDNGDEGHGTELFTFQATAAG
jgi:hypothetical protein